MRWLAAWLQILRISGAVTLLSNAVAAWAFVIYVDGSDPLLLAEKLYRTSHHALWVLATSLLLYLNGMLWNALLDMDRDRELHPTRPLITGRISPGTAMVVGCLLSVGTLLVGLQLGFRGFLSAGVVLMLTFCYNAAAKHLPYLGSICMGLVRAAHAVFVLLALGPDLFDRMLITSVSWLVDVESMGLVGLPPVYPLLLFSYVCGLTLISELESRFGRRIDLLLATLLLVAPIPFLLLRIFG
ncbi:MAG: UbiA family prenyltransferase, partial [Planctomycetota bacterium]